MADTFTTDLKEFIGRYIHSVAQLEILLMLRSEPHRSWTPQEVTQKLYLQVEMTSQLLEEIVQRGLATKTENGFYYRPISDLDRDAIDRLAQIYQERRVAVIAEIFSKPKDSLRAFADAFRMRREV